MGFYARYMDRWERKLASRDTNRVARDFDWGLDWLATIGLTPNGSAGPSVMAFSRAVAGNSDAFFSYERPTDFHLLRGLLRFTSPVTSPYATNNIASARFFPAAQDHGRAVLVLPQWNSDAASHSGLCRLLNRFGITALRLTLAYHAERRPADVERAEYHVSSNIGRTIHASRQSVIDARCCLDWLQQQGYDRLGILGTSLGSCIAFIAAAHDSRIRAGVFNHVSMYFSDVVWTGLSTRHVRSGIEGRLSQDELRMCWTPISPATYLDRLQHRDLASLLVWARHDSTFLPEYSLQVLDGFRRRGYRHETFCLPCGHYTTGAFPFNWLDGLVMCRFLAKSL
jgi:hypothetical protein